jgi:hypothetical protein
VRKKMRLGIKIDEGKTTQATARHEFKVSSGANKVGLISSKSKYPRSKSESE